MATTNELNILLYALLNFIVLYCDKKTIEKIDVYNFKKTFKIHSSSIIEIPDEIVTKQEIEEKIYNGFKDKILEFERTLKDNISQINRNLFYKNLHSLKISEYNAKTKINKNTILKAIYDPIKNEIIFYNKSNKSIFHELFHMSSTIIKNNIIFCGFSQTNIVNKTCIGKSLNEGYTQYLVKKYFNKYHNENSYFIEVNCIERIEKVIGKDVMEYLYFHADLNGLINELNKYICKEEVINFISNFDFITNYKYQKQTRSRDKYILEKLSNVLEFIMKLEGIKICLNYSSNNITKEQCIQEITNFYIDDFYSMLQSDIKMNLIDELLKLSNCNMEL